VEPKPDPVSVCGAGHPYLCGPFIPKPGMAFKPCFQYEASNQSIAQQRAVIDLASEILITHISIVEPVDSLDESF